VISPVLFVGQAPGTREQQTHKPFAWTAGKTLFGWFATIGVSEEAFRNRIYMAAVCRCFPGKNPAGGDRVPAPDEVTNCSAWIHAELQLLQPELIIPAGKLAIASFLESDRLDQVVGQCHRVAVSGRDTDIIPLPHPSGASTWRHTEPGKTLLRKALGLISQHPAWQKITAAI
jgi:uracil-DNA glycosylase